jgi:hypothetical protein
MGSGKFPMKQPFENMNKLTRLTQLFRFSANGSGAACVSVIVGILRLVL